MSGYGVGYSIEYSLLRKTHRRKDFDTIPETSGSELSESRVSISIGQVLTTNMIE